MDLHLGDWMWGRTESGQCLSRSITTALMWQEPIQSRGVAATLGRTMPSAIASKLDLTNYTPTNMEMEGRRAARFRRLDTFHVELEQRRQ